MFFCGNLRLFIFQSLHHAEVTMNLARLSRMTAFLCFGLAINDVSSQELHPALNNPDKFAWDLFIAINHPADLNAERGTPDRSKKLGDPGPTVWETWKLARTEIYLPNACKPAAWTSPSAALANVTPLAARFRGPPANTQHFKVFDPPKFSEDIAQTLGTSVNRTNFEPANRQWRGYSRQPGQKSSSMRMKSATRRE
jgi:hypothetical protein